jgi:hypothetical protein
LEPLEPRVLLAGVWTPETVVYDLMSDTDGTLLGGVSLKIDKNNDPHVSYTEQYEDPIAGLQSRLRYARWDGAAWARQTVALAGGTVTSLAIDGSGKARISYVNASGEIGYAAWNGTAWDLKVVEAAAGSATALVLDKNNNPRVAYTTASGDVRYAAWSGSAWTAQTVAAGPAAGLSLVLDKGNRARLSYVVGQDLKYAAWNGSAWTTQIVDTAAQGFGAGHSSLALDPDDKPAIAYDGAAGHTLAYAAWNGSAWLKETVESPGATADEGTVSQVSLVIDNARNPHVSYLAGPGAAVTTVRYAARDGAAWAFDTLSTSLPGLAAAGPSLALEKKVNPRLAYLTVENAKTTLKYARFTATPANAPLAMVSGNGNPVLDNSNTPSLLNGTDFGSVVQGEPALTQVFTVWNPGTADLKLGTPTLPAGFVLAEPLAGTIHAGGSDTFTIRLDTEKDGTFGGPVSFSTNAAGMDPFNFRLAAVVTKSPNHAPSFTMGPDLAADEDAVAQVLAPWATAISAGPSFESGQKLTFTVSNDNPALFNIQPAMTPDGTLTFSSVPNANGAATVTVTLKDNGGTVNGGVDTTPAQTFVITVTPVNDRPVAGGQTASVPPAGSLEIVLVVSDTETALADLVFTITEGPAHGVLTPLAPGRYRYDVDAGYAGLDRFTYTVTDSGDPAGTHGGPGDQTSLPATVDLLSGEARPLVSGKTLTFIDSHQAKVTVALSGPGAAQLLFAHADPCDLGGIYLTGTTAASALSITTPLGLFTPVGGIRATGPLGRISAGTTQLGGDLVVGGMLGSLTLDDVTGALIRIGGSPASTTAATLKFDRVIDADVDSAMPIGSLAATQWLEVDGTANTIRAPRLGTLTIAGSTTRGMPGDFAANLALSGLGVTALSKTLGTATVKGRVGATLWDVTGKVGTVTVLGTVGAAGNPWRLTGAAAVATLSLGDVVEAQVTVSGEIGTAAAKRWLDGAVRANRIGALLIPGLAATKTAPAVPGDFGADLTLAGAGLLTYVKTLGTVGIKGSLAPSTWDVTGKVGTVTVAGGVGAAGDPWQLRNSSSVASLALGDVADATVAASGAIGTVAAKRWLDGALRAATIGSVAITGVAATQTRLPVSGDFRADLTLTGQDAMGKSLGTLSVAGTMAGDITLPGAAGSIAAARWAAGSLTARSVGTVTVKGDMTGVTLGLSQAPSALKKALGTLTVGGWADTVTVDAAGHIGAVTVGGLKSTSVRAGDPVNNAVARGTIGVLTVRGVPGEAHSVIDLSVEAWTLGTVVLRNVNTANAGTFFGLVGHALGAYTRYQGKDVAAKAWNVTGPQHIEQATDFLVELV